MTAAVIVTHNSERFVGAVLDSVFDQTSPVDLVVVVDDNSVDGTIAAVDHAVARARTTARPVPMVRTLASTSGAVDRATRIAANFVQGVQACAAHDIVILGDHDDHWHKDRVAHQAGTLRADDRLAMLAGNGALVDAGGARLAGTLHDAFPVPPDFAEWPIGRRIGYVLGHSIATGGASALRPVLLGEFLEVPKGWLHDRWWSIAATAINAIDVDARCVIDYRVHAGQQVGLDRGTQDSGAPRRMVGKFSPATLSRLRDVHRLGRRLTSAEARDALGWGAIVRSALG